MAKQRREGAESSGALGGVVDALLRELPEAERAAVVDHVRALIAMAPERRAALLAFVKASGGT